MNITRRAQVIGLAEGAAEAYERLHAAVWPEVLDRLERSHISNYSIFRHGEVLFSYFEYSGSDWEADEAAIAADPATRRWWKLTEPLQRRVSEADEGEFWHRIPEVFHHDGDELSASHRMLMPRNACDMPMNSAFIPNTSDV